MSPAKALGEKQEAIECLITHHSLALTIGPPAWVNNFFGIHASRWNNSNREATRYRAP